MRPLSKSSLLSRKRFRNCPNNSSDDTISEAGSGTRARKERDVLSAAVLQYRRSIRVSKRVAKAWQQRWKPTQTKQVFLLQEFLRESVPSAGVSLGDQDIVLAQQISESVQAKERPVMPEHSFEVTVNGGEEGSDGGCLTTTVAPGVTSRAKWQMVIGEIVDTEKTYVTSLKDVVEGYLLALGPYAPALDITQEEVTVLFGNVKHLLTFNSKLLESLCESRDDPLKICSCFVERKEAFNDLYTDYCTNYPHSVAKLQDLNRRPGSGTAEFFKACQRRLRHMLPLGAQLIRPVQRVLKYHLLMRELKKNCHLAEEDEQTLQEALDTMQAVAEHINKMKREHEKAVYVQEIQQRLVNWEGDDLSSYGELVLEGALKQQNSLWRASERYAFLFEKLFLLAKDKEGQLHFKAFVKIDDLGLSEIAEDPTSFRVTPLSSLDNSLTFQAIDEENKWMWMDALRQVVVNHAPLLSEDAKKSLVSSSHLSLCGQTSPVSRVSPDSTKKGHAGDELFRWPSKRFRLHTFGERRWSWRKSNKSPERHSHKSKADEDSISCPGDIEDNTSLGDGADAVNGVAAQVVDKENTESTFRSRRSEGKGTVRRMTFRRKKQSSKFSESAASIDGLSTRRVSEEEENSGWPVADTETVSEDTNQDNRHEVNRQSPASRQSWTGFDVMGTAGALVLPPTAIYLSTSFSIQILLFVIGILLGCMLLHKWKERHVRV